MTAFHRYLGTFIVVLLLAMVITGVVMRLAGRRDTPTAVWGLQHWTENLLVVQTVIGLAFLLLGRRVPPEPLSWLHYLYGSLFPLLAMVGGRLAAMRRETRAYVGLAWGALFGFGLTLRAVQTGCGLAVPLLDCILR